MAGERPDRFAASFWRHFYHREHSAEGTAEAMLGFQKRYDWDFIKINPRATYHVEDWGVRMKWSRDEFTNHERTAVPVTVLDDWNRILPHNPSSPVLAEHLKVISLVRKGVGKEVPVLMTVFTPLSIAGWLVSEPQVLLDHLHRAPEKVEQALRAITTTFVRFTAEVRNAGADGLFFATTLWASRNMLTWEEYRRFGVAHDLEVIKAAEDDAINLLHVCSSQNFLKQLSEIDYHCHLYNWDSDEATNVTLDAGYDLLPGKTLVGGVDRRGWLLKGTADEAAHRVDDLMIKHDSNRLVVGPGCAVPPEVPPENLLAVRGALDG